MTVPPDNGLASDIHRLARRLFYESKKRGEQNDQMLMLTGGCLSFIGCTMSLDAFRRISGKNGRGGRGR